MRPRPAGGLAQSLIGGTRAVVETASRDFNEAVEVYFESADEGA